MDLYDFKMMGHSGFENCRIVDSASYSEFNVDGTLFKGDVDDAPECLDGLEITSIDVWFNPTMNRIEATIDVEGVDEEIRAELRGEAEDDVFDGLPSDGSEPQLASSDLEAGQWHE